MRKVVRLTEMELRHMISESVKRALNEIDYSTMPLGDYNERNAWWKTQADADFPEHGVKDSRNWQETYNMLAQKKKEQDKIQKKKDKENAKLQKMQQKFDKLRDKINLYEKALSWAIEGNEQELSGYDEMLNYFPIVVKIGPNEQKKVRAKIDSLTNNGYAGMMKFNGQQYYVTLNNCDIWINDDCKVDVRLDNIKAESDSGEKLDIYSFDVIATMQAMKVAFTKKVKENVRYMTSANAEEEPAMNESRIHDIVKQVLESKLNEVERSFPNAIPGDEDIYYPGDINPDVWDALQRGDFGDDDEPDEVEFPNAGLPSAVNSIVAEAIRKVLKQKR